MNYPPPIYVGQFDAMHADDVVDLFLDIAAELTGEETITDVDFSVVNAAGYTVAGVIGDHTESGGRTDFRVTAPSLAGVYQLTAVFTISDGQRLTRVATLPVDQAIVDSYFTVEELRAEFPDLVSTTKYPDAKLAAARAFAEQWFETAAHVAYVQREATETLTGNGKIVLFLSATVEVGAVTAATIDAVALTVDELADLVVRRYGAVHRAATWPQDATIEITYTHGYAEPVELAKQAVMMLAAEHAKPSTIPARATSLSTDIGNYRISQADKTGKTGIPDVDAIIGLLGDDKPVTG